MMRKLLLLSTLFLTPAVFAQLTDPNPGDDWEITQVGANNLLTNPYDIETGPDGYLWITERSLGQISRFDPATGAKDMLVSMPSVVTISTQTGIMGLALHPQLGQGTGNDYVYTAYTYNSADLKLRISRFTYSKVGNDGILSDEWVLLEGVPASYDHNSGRLAIGPDMKLYYTIGDHGNNQFDNACKSIRAQLLPTSPSDYNNYPGKVLRMNLDGSIPSDNPLLDGVQSHVYSYGHRNLQGLAFGGDGKLYTSEHGPKSDDELNLIESGKNYGWPNIAGYIDDQSYAYCNRSLAPDCNPANFSDYDCLPGITPVLESQWTVPGNYANPIHTWGTVPDGYDFQAGCGYICWPSVAPCGIDIYEGGSIPNWGKSVLTTTLKRGRIYRVALAPDGTQLLPIADPEPDGNNDDSEELWYTPNRYRDIAIGSDGLTFYIITDSLGATSGPSNNNPIAIQNPGIIIKVRYIGPLSTDTFASNASLEILPNPTSEQFKISNASKSELDKVQVADLNGRVLKQVPLSGNDQAISIEDLNPGTYMIVVFDKAGNRTTKKLVVNR